MSGRAGSSKLFVITAVIFQDMLEASACEREIESVRRRLSFTPGSEFHFAHCSDRVRKLFLQAVCVSRFKYYSFVICKERLWGERFRDGRKFYSFAAQIVCENAKPLFDNAKIIIDKCGDRNFKRQLERDLKLCMNVTGREHLIKKVVMEESGRNNLLQLADMVCGAVARSCTMNDHVYRNLVSKREGRVQFWPKI
jgi:hypothetical protein